jgi:hypothetical protein
MGKAFKNMGNKNYMSVEKKWTTTDLALTAAMMSLGHRLDSLEILLEGSNRRPKGEFLMVDTPELREHEDLYWSGECLVEPKTFVSHQRSLKSMVNQEIERLER